VKHLFAVLWLALLALATPAAAQTFPANNGSPIVDQAGILRPEQVLDLKSKSEALYAQSGRAFAVATVKSLEDYPVDDYAYRLGRFWKLGSAKDNNGVLLLVAPNEHKVSIATGYGAGAYMTDAMSGVIIREAILPHFKQSPPDYGGGIEAGADAIIKQMSLPADQAAKNVAVASQAQQQRQRSGGNPLPVVFWLLVIGFVIAVPVSYYFISKWLTNFTYHMSIDVLTYVVSFVMVLLIVSLTIAYHALKASVANPVNSLRSE